MKLWMRSLWLSGMVVLVLNLKVVAVAAPAAPTDAANTLRVLFIGNSYTFINDLPKLTSHLAASARPAQRLETQLVAEGGATLKRHWETGKALEAIRKGKWDYVVLQGQSTLGGEEGSGELGSTEIFHDYARRFDAEVKKSGAKTVFFLTWARRDSPENQPALTQAHAAIAKELKATLAPVGIAWQFAAQQNPRFALHHADGSHPAEAGSYLAACVLYAVLFSRSPEGLDPWRVSPGDAVSLQRMAWRAIQADVSSLTAVKAPSTSVTSVDRRPAATAADAANSPEAQERGRGVLRAAQKAAGGIERLRSIKDVVVVTAGKMFGPQAEMAFDGRETFVFPSLQRSEQKFPFGEVISFFDGTNGWRKGPQGVRDLPDGMKNVLRAQVLRNTFNLLRAEGDFSVHFEKQEKVGETLTDVILVTIGGEKVRLYVESAGGMLRKKSYRGAGSGGPADIEETYFDYREISGVRFPFRVEVTQNGARFIEATITEVRFDTAPDSSALGRKPE